MSGGSKPTHQLLSNCCSFSSYMSGTSLCAHDDRIGADTFLASHHECSCWAVPIVMHDRATAIPQYFFWDSVLFLWALDWKERILRSDFDALII